jgi:hypothetical protein
LEDYNKNEMAQLLSRMLKKRPDVEFDQNEVALQVLAGQIYRASVDGDMTLRNMNALPSGLDQVIERRDVRFQKEMMDLAKMGDRQLECSRRSREPPSKEEDHHSG